MRKIVFNLMVGAVALALAGPAMAAATVDLTAGATGGLVGSKSFVGSDGTKVNVTAFSIDSSNIMSIGSLGLYTPGLGEQNSSGDDSHTLDNSGRRDFLLLSFDKYVTLSQISLNTNFAYNSGSGCLCDSDATIGAAYPLALAWNADLSSFSGQNLSSLGLQTWSADTTSTSATQTRSVNAGAKGGTLWLVGSSFNNTDGLIDGFKLKTVTYAATTPPVPEPATWAMLILGMGGVGAAMRRRTRARLAFA